MKKSLLKKVLVGFAAIIVILVIVIATRDPECRIQRSITINAPANAAYALVSDFHQWGNWSPWEKVDPGMKRTFSEKAAGTGATYYWVGNNDVGEGKMTMLQCDEPNKVVIQLDFIKPMAATNTATFTFDKQTDGTKVTWLMEGKKNFIAKAFSMFVNVDKMVGSQFETGLTAMKQAAEKSVVDSAQPAVGMK